MTAISIATKPAQMPPTPNSGRVKPSAKAGFTLMEILIVLAIIAGVTAVAMMNGNKVLQNSFTQSEIYNVRRQVLDLKERAFRENRVLDLRDSGDEDALAAAQQIADYQRGVLTDADEDGVQDDLPNPLPVTLTLGEGFSYSLELEPREQDGTEGIIGMAVTPRGECTPVTLTLKRDEVAVATLSSEAGDGCHLVRAG